MNMCRLNDTPYFVWMVDEKATVDLIKFLQERGTRIPYTDRDGLKFKGNNVDRRV
jgi:hypothetical protein